MSYILEALRKSEEERKRGDVPTISQPFYAENQAPQQKNSVKWIGLVVLLLAVNLLVAMFWLGTQFNKDDGKTVATQDDKAAATVTQSLNPQNQTTLPKKEVQQPQPQLAKEPVTTNNTVKKPVKTAVAVKESVTIVPKQTVNDEPTHYEVIKPKNVGQARSSTKDQESPAETIARLVKEESSAEDDYSDLPYLSELSNGERAGMPALNFSSHMFSSNPQSRSVIINGARYREHENLTQDLSIHAITQEGVVFDWKHALYRVNIMQQWTIE